MSRPPAARRATVHDLTRVVLEQGSGVTVTHKNGLAVAARPLRSPKNLPPCLTKIRDMRCLPFGDAVILNQCHVDALTKQKFNEAITLLVEATQIPSKDLDTWRTRISSLPYPTQLGPCHPPWNSAHPGRSGPGDRLAGCRPMHDTWTLTMRLALSSSLTLEFPPTALRAGQLALQLP